MESSAETSLRKDQKEAVGLLSIGTFLEYFDLMLYVHMTVFLNELFFPACDSYTTSLLTSLAFCTPFIFRPIGAMIFGWIGDNIGRKATITLTTLLMAGSCVTMALIPTYAEIGIKASICVIICRVIQGISSMGELIGAELYVTETVKPPIQYFAVTLISAFANCGTIFALLVATLVTSSGLNWRFAFWIGAGIALVGVVARTRLRETPDFIDAERKYQRLLEEEKDIKRNKRDIFLIKLFDRYHNIQTLVFKSVEKQRKIAKETLTTFVSMAAHLGLYKVEHEINDYCINILNNPKLKRIYPDSNIIIDNEAFETKLIDKLEEVNKNRLIKIDISLIKKAIECAKLSHGEQARLSGELYYTHPIEVAYMIVTYSAEAGYRFSTDTIIAAILHDVVEDTNFNIEMVELTFGKDVTEIVYGLTRVRLDQKLSAPELLELVFNKVPNLQEEQINKKTAFSLFLMDCGWPVAFYIGYFYCAVILRDNFHYSQAEIIQHNLIIACVNFTERLVLSYLSYKIYPLKILKFKCWIFTFFILIAPYLLGNVGSPLQLMLIQCLIIIFGCTPLPSVPILYKHLPVFKRFTCASLTYALSTALIYVATSFGLIYFTGYAGHYGILAIVVPSVIAFMYGLKHFEKLEKSGDVL